MRTFNISFLVVLSCIAMIGATPIGNGNPNPSIVDKDFNIPSCSGDQQTKVADISIMAKYIALQQLMEVLT